MSDLGHHGEWLSLLDVSGPFLAEPVLKEALPQGLQGLDPVVKKEVRQAYDEWREALDFEEKDLAKLHQAWISFVLDRVLGYGTDFILTGETITTRFRHVVPENGVTLLPDAVVTDGKTGGKSLLLVKTYETHVALSEAASEDGWAASAIERMVELCRATGVRLGLVTNGEQWALVDAPVGVVVSIASWYARLWSQEPLTLQAFAELLGIRRFFGGQDAALATLLDKSLSLQDEVTDALGEQVRRAVEVLVQSLDRADQDRNRELLRDVSPEELYEAGLTIMMRIVFLLSAEERGLLLLGDRHYETNYAVSTLRGQLRQEADEVLERRWDAWSRLLSLFRAVFAGVDHGTMRMPALGGSLFDPDRFPFLEGRSTGSNWKTDTAVPLPIDNRTVLLLLEAVQLYQGRTLSYLALDVEQIGYVYEGLLERTVVRAAEATLDLKATKSAIAPWVKLSELDDAATKGGSAVEELLKEKTGSSTSRIHNDLAKKPDEGELGKLLAACGGNVGLRDRIKPYFYLLRTDSWGYPLIYPKGTFMVANGSDRRETGTHYTPKSFTEAIVKTTLEPLVYVGPREGAPQVEWRLRSVDELLDLKICDPAMGSGAFLVQVCRYMAERVVEAWGEAERRGKAVSAEGEVKDELSALEPLSQSGDERSLTAKRIIAERCLYGIDMNPLAVELAKLSIWLVTLAKGRPFGFLDHNLRSGDSLVGIASLNQVRFLEMKPNDRSVKKLFASQIDTIIRDTLELRSRLRTHVIRDIRDVEAMSRLDAEARQKLTSLDLVADALTGYTLANAGRTIDSTGLSFVVGGALAGEVKQTRELEGILADILSNREAEEKRRSRTFHWALEFPEVFARERPGFDAIVGNPPFLGSQKISGTFGADYKDYLSRQLVLGDPAAADLVVFFFLRSFELIRVDGHQGLLARRSIAEGRNREIGLAKLIEHGGVIRVGYTNMPWPGKAAVVVHEIFITKGSWAGAKGLNGLVVDTINSYIENTELLAPRPLEENVGRMFQGTILNNENFKISVSDASCLIERNAQSSDVMFPFIGGSELNTDPEYRPSCWVVCFWDWPEAKAKQYSDAFQLLRKQFGDGEHLEGWWRFLRPRPDLYHALGRGDSFVRHPTDWHDQIPRRERVLVIARGASKYPAFTFLPNNFVFSEKLYVVPDDRFTMFGVLSSSIHSVWAWAQKTSLGADLHSMSYTHGNIFETFPFPGNVLTEVDQELEALGERLFVGRTARMQVERKGLTRFYNDFHDPALAGNDLTTLRSIQAELDHAVCSLYGWDDLDLDVGFHGVAYLPEGRNIRFGMSEEARLEIVRRLSGLNISRHASQQRESALVGQLSGVGTNIKRRKRATKQDTADVHGDLLERRR